MWKEEDHDRDENGRFTSKKNSDSEGELQEELAEEPKYIPVTPITDEAIERVPVVDIPGYTPAECEEIARQHKELLRYARDNNSHGEVAFVFRDGLKDRKIFRGTDNDIDFGYALSGYGNCMLILHNHPRNKSFSLYDLYTFSDDAIKTMTVVKNNGSVEVMTKTDSFSRAKFITELNRVKSSSTSIEKAIAKLLPKMKGSVLWNKED